MIIAVNAVTPALPREKEDFFTAAFIELAARQPQHHFLFIGFTQTGSTPANGTFVNVPVIKTPLRYKYWLSFRLPAILKKNKAVMLISNNTACPRIKIPQVFYCSNLLFLHPASVLTKSWHSFYKKNMQAGLPGAAHIISSSGFLKSKITDNSKVDEAKVTIVYAAAAAIYKPVIHWNQKEVMKEKLTGGKEYFLYTGFIHAGNNLINLLKAFTFFKQRQKSNMQLVLASSIAADDALIKILSTYKYRTEVVVTENLSLQEMASVTAAAYAVILPGMQDAECLQAIQAMQCNTPITAANNTALLEICGDAAVYFYADDFNDMAAKMMLLFTNEDRRNILIAKSREQIRAFTLEDSVNKIAAVIEKATAV